MEYKIPKQYYFRLHHVRPRFKGDIENVLIYMAEELRRVGECPADVFVSKINMAIYRYPGNANKALKTINNWRTEISALFGFIEKTDTMYRPGRRALELAEKQDLVESFKIFLYNFQYPGAHIKSQEVLEEIRAGIKFKPAQYILKLLRFANRDGGNALGITKAEACHCIFNDLRVTRDNEGAEATWNRIVANRKNGLSYDETGDVIRYAGDVIDYMEIANLLKSYDSRMYYLNTLEEETIVKFCESTEWFSEYDNMINRHIGNLNTINNCVRGWFSYVNRDIKDTDFSTDILAYIASDESDLKALYAGYQKREAEYLERISETGKGLSTKETGDIGEGLIHGHECMRVKLEGREDLIHLIKRIPTQFAVGYDIQSVEAEDERKRYIEVKTTISSKPIRFNRVHMTKNEWNAANSMRDRYYVYRLHLSKKEKTLFLMQDPVGLYKQDKIDMIPTDGADIIFNPMNVGRFTELLTWRD